jgi:hypothetical protein
MNQKIKQPVSALIISIFMLAMLAGCQEKMNDIGRRMGLVKTAAGQNLVTGSAYYEFPAFSPGTHHKPESTFCYKVQTDILCYEQPRAGWENRLVGYQEPMRQRQNQSQSVSYPQNNPPPVTTESIVTNTTPFGMASGNQTIENQEVGVRNLPPLPSVTVQ